MKNVLFVADQFLRGGLETRVAQQVKVYHERGVRAFLVAQDIDPEMAGVFDGVTQMDLSWQTIEDIAKRAEILAQIAQEYQAEMIDCHPLMGGAVAALAALQLQIPMTYTIHGRFAIPVDNNPAAELCYLFLWGGCTRFYTTSEKLQNYFSDFLSGTDCKVARNGILMLNNIPRRREVEVGKWVFASRLTEDKVTPLISSLPILKQAEITTLDIYGEGPMAKELEVAALKSGIKLRILGWCNDIQHMLIQSRYEGILGMGRVVVEAMSVGVPTMVLGYEGLTGAMSNKTVTMFQKDNFTSYQAGIPREILKDFQMIRQNPEKFDMTNFVREHLDAHKLWEKYWTEVSRLERNRKDDRLFQWVAELYQKVEKSRLLQDRLGAEVQNLERSMADLRNSTSWKITKPMRKLKAVVRPKAR